MGKVVARLSPLDGYRHGRPLIPMRRVAGDAPGGGAKIAARLAPQPTLDMRPACPGESEKAKQGNEGQRNKTDAVASIPLTHIPLPFPAGSPVSFPKDAGQNDGAARGFEQEATERTETESALCFLGTDAA